MYKLGNYQVDMVKNLGSGTFGTVYRATRRGKTYAAKRFNNKGIDKTKVMEEVTAMQTLNGHKNVVNVEEFIEKDKEMWLIMEFGDLGDLQGFLDSTKLSTIVKKRLMHQCAAGLLHIHNNNIVHRDMKPSNIIMCNVNGAPEAKITDFGEVKMFDGTQDLMKTIVGTQFYWAPEMFDAYNVYMKYGGLLAREYKAFIDVFALGLIFLVIVQNGGLPISEEEHKKFLARLNPNPIGLDLLAGKKSTFATDASSDDRDAKLMKSIVRRMLHKEENSRLPLQQVLDELQPVVVKKPEKTKETPKPEETAHHFEVESVTVVAAIDFGTTYSGYAFSFKTDPENIYMAKDWDSKEGFISFKAPTSVLVDSRGHFVDFGYAAEKRYSEDFDGNLQLYRHFKMRLHKKGVSSTTKILSVAGHPMPALDIFAMALNYLKRHLENHLKPDKAETIGIRTADMIKWVITVPAIWSDEAKHFMRKAAFQAGLIKTVDSKRLLIALEPEAASFYCRGLNTRFDVGKPVNFQPGESYMIVDAGGGTVDITAHEILGSGQIREIEAANGDAMGGTRVDQNIMALLEEMLGLDFVQRYQKECPQGWFRIIKELEIKKKSIQANKAGILTIPVDAMLGGKYQEMTGRSVEKVGSEGNKGYKFSNGTFIISSERVKGLFDPVIGEIVSHIKKQTQKPSIRKCQYLIMVGGFGECTFLQKAIRDHFGKDFNVMVPSESEIAVIKGAVLFGHKPNLVKGRVAMRTYGTYSTPKFDPAKHDPNHKILEDGVELCNRVFNSFIQKGDIVETGKTITRYFMPNSDKQQKMYFNLFSLDRPTLDTVIEYVDSPEFQKVGDIAVHLTKHGKGEECIVGLNVTFGGTEIQVEAKDHSTDVALASPTTINFLAK